MEMQTLSSDTLIVTNSKELYKCLKPENEGRKFDQKKFTMPLEGSFKFFGQDDKDDDDDSQKLTHQKMYQEAAVTFETDQVYGFYPNDHNTDRSFRNLNNQPCKSRIDELESFIRDSSNNDDVYIIIVNEGSIDPVEVRRCSPTHLKYNYFDPNDISNQVYSKYIYNEMVNTILGSNLVKTYFGGENNLESKSSNLFNDTSKAITPLILGWKGDRPVDWNLKGEKYPKLAEIDFYINFEENPILQSYFSPMAKSVKSSSNGWLGPGYFNQVYGGVHDRGIDSAGWSIEVFPNIKPFPYSGTEKFFAQPFTLEVLNFGQYNYLHTEETSSHATELHNAFRVMAFVRYESFRGKMIFFMCFYKFSLGFFIDNPNSTIDINLRSPISSLEFRLLDANRQIIPVDEDSILIVKLVSF